MIRLPEGEVLEELEETRYRVWLSEMNPTWTIVLQPDGRIAAKLEDGTVLAETEPMAVGARYFVGVITDGVGLPVAVETEPV